MADNKTFRVTLMLLSDMEKGVNPDFFFGTFQEAVNFIKVCFDNFYTVEFEELEAGKDE